MSSAPPPNEELAELSAVLGEDNVRTLVRTFLRDFSTSFDQLTGGDRKNRHRIAHSMKSNSRLVGAHQLSEFMAALEARLESSDGADVTPDDLASITAQYERIAPALRDFAGN